MTARRALPDPDGNAEAARLQARSDAAMAAITATLADHLPSDLPWPERSMLALDLRRRVLAAIDQADAS